MKKATTLKKSALPNKFETRESHVPESKHKCCSDRELSGNAHSHCREQIRRQSHSDDFEATINDCYKDPPAHLLLC